jgi:hypothetical protein
MKSVGQRKISLFATRKVTALAVIAVFLIAAETYAAAHRADLETHYADGLCKICLTISGFTDGNIGHADISLDSPASPQSNTADESARVFQHVVIRRARGPPSTS